MFFSYSTQAQSYERESTIKIRGVLAVTFTVKKAVRVPRRVFSLIKVHSGRFCGVFPGIEPKNI